MEIEEYEAVVVYCILLFYNFIFFRKVWKIYIFEFTPNYFYNFIILVFLFLLYFLYLFYNEFFSDPIL